MKDMIIAGAVAVTGLAALSVIDSCEKKYTTENCDLINGSEDQIVHAKALLDTFHKTRYYSTCRGVVLGAVAAAAVSAVCNLIFD